MKNNISPDDLAVFLSVLSEGGFRAAARKRGIAASKVSTTVSRIERELGVPLLRRTTRSVRPTDHGQALADRLAPLLAEVDLACAETASAAGSVQGVLKLNVPGAVVPDVLPPLLAEYHRKHPKVHVELVVDNDLVDIVSVGCDAGIRYGDVLEKDMISVPIGPRKQRFALAASPGYLAAKGQPDRPEMLTGYDAIRYRLPDGPLLPWTLQKGHETLQVEPITRLTLSVNALHGGLSYARAGLGLIGTFHNWLEDDLRTGALVPVLKDWWPQLEGPRLYYPNRFTAAPLRAFIELCGT